MSMPQQLMGKILFISNRSGGPEPLIFKRVQDQIIYVFDPATGELGVLTNRLFYDAAVVRDAWSADQRYRVFVKTGPVVGGKKFPTLYYHDYFYNVETQLTTFGHGVSWDPVWSPTQEKIAFISNETGDSEIWVMNRDGSSALRLTETNEAYNAQQIGKDTFVPEVNGKPSWSPDGNQIVFWSNRGGTRQLWIMNADGSNPYTISMAGYDDWDPVWVKYTDPARRP